MKTIFQHFFMLAFCCHLFHPPTFGQSNWQIKPVQLQTRWAKEVTPNNALPEYPRPQMVRSEWQNLNGLWQYAITAKDADMPQKFDDRILVPYPVESALSGVKKNLLPEQRLWYRRTIKKPNQTGTDRVLLHFGAVDWQAVVYINGQQIGEHQGGYQNFSFDITNALKKGDNQLTVAVYDPSDQGPNPHGKQVLHPQNILYTASSGIWQTVWLETVPAVHIGSLTMTPAIDQGYLSLKVNVKDAGEGYTVEAVAKSNGAKIGTITGNANTDLQLLIPNAHLWSPNDPFLYDLSIRLLYKNKVVDTVGSYFGMRKIEIKKDELGQERIFLNNKYTYNLGVLDQGFWPDGLYTAPTDEALKFDIAAIKSMGFNTIRKHIKLEPARWYYHCDKTGMLVWQDMVTCANESPAAKAAFEKENQENITQLHNYPSIICWVLFNEGWARYDQQRLTEWMKKADPSRIIDGHTGENYDRNAPKNPMEKWISSDLTDIHDYPGPGIAPALPGKARVLGEWGGVQVQVPSHQWNEADGWGYISLPAAQFARKYEFMMKHLKVYEEEGLSGSIYTEPFDVETEENGLLTYDREVIKIPVDQLRKIHAMIIPPTSEVLTAFSAQNMDTTNPDNMYTKLLQQYQDGNYDLDFLRNLSQMAVRKNDPANAAKMANEYISQLKPPYTPGQLKYINKFTNSTKDRGFAIINKYQEQFNSVLGTRRAEVKLMNIIFQDEISPYVSEPQADPDWNLLAGNIKKYGAPGEEIFLRAKTIHYLNKQEWDSFATTADQYIQKCAPYISAQDLNSYAWTVFENVMDTTHLANALNWSRRCIQVANEPAYIDTYANVLYKSGKTTDAIAYEEKALNLAPDNEKKTYQETLTKMKNGARTWK
ncbi:sugar-binding domain-containing protein [Chitinophaga sp. MM2321]|uniref:glycoside hydrolase family 2 protein n=1 Tax=Chitinophaga sp. MM2321 TaxID=3137178 RepID=UPI0032D595D2